MAPRRKVQRGRGVTPVFERDMSSRPGADWSNRIVTIWEEDDAPVPDKERFSHAWERIRGDKYDEKRMHSSSVIATYDGGDWYVRLHPYGWVSGGTCSGAFIGIIVNVRL
jgi:hypothetical protein